METTLRDPKKDLSLRPVWHVEQDRIQAHLMIVVLDYHEVHLLCMLLPRVGIHTDWVRVPNKFASWMRVTTTLKTAEGDLISTVQDTRADTAEAAVTQAVGVGPRLHRQRRHSRLLQLSAYFRPSGRLFKSCSDSIPLVHLVCH